jgi:hypothetical protein
MHTLVTSSRLPSRPADRCKGIQAPAQYHQRNNIAELSFELDDLVLSFVLDALLSFELVAEHIFEPDLQVHVADLSFELVDFVIEFLTEPPGQTPAVLGR